MRFWTAYAFLALSISKVYAAGGGHGDGHHASITDLVAPAVNIGILLGVLVWKLKGPMKEYFVSKSKDVSNTLERADMKSKEAALMLAAEEKKLAGLNSELSSIAQDSEKEVAFFEQNLARETSDKTQKMKTDASMKIEADKKALLDELNAELLNQVILKTKSTIKTNKDYQNKVSTKLLQGL